MTDKELAKKIMDLIDKDDMCAIQSFNTIQFIYYTCEKVLDGELNV